MKLISLTTLLLFAISCFTQTERSSRLGFFITPLIYQIENPSDFINTINKNYTSVNHKNATSHEFGISYIFSKNNLNIGGGVSMKDYSMELDINFSTFELNPNSISSYFTKPINLKRKSIGFFGLVGYHITKNTEINFIVNYYHSFELSHNIIPGKTGKIVVLSGGGYNVEYKENLVSFRRRNIIPEINFTTTFLNGFYINYGVKSKVRKINYFSASLIGKTSSTSNPEILLDMIVYSRHTAIYAGIGYRFRLRNPKNRITIN